MKFKKIDKRRANACIAIATMLLMTGLALFLASCSTHQSLLKPDRRDQQILINDPPFMFVENCKGRVKWIYFDCDSCKVDQYLINKGLFGNR